MKNHLTISINNLSLGMLLFTCFQSPVVLAQLEEVTVTARRVEESLQDTPVSVSAFSGDNLEAQAALDLMDIGDMAPNVNMSTGSATSGLSSAPSVFIRGIGQDDFIIVTDPAVGMYVDGIYLGRSIGSLVDLLDMERVEVLRGPQGTLYGRNSIGGAVNFVSKKPDPEAFSGKVGVTVGEDEHYEFNGSVNVPFSDKAAGRFSAMYRHRDGFVDALQYDDVKLGDDNVWAMRGALLFEPTDNLTIELAGDYSQERENPAPLVPVSIGGGNGAPTDSGTAFTNSTRGGNASVIFNRSSVVGMGPPLPLVTAVPGSPAAAVSLTDGVVSGDPACAVADPDNAIGPPADNPNCHGNFWLGGDYGNNSVWTDADGNPVVPENAVDSYGFSVTFTLDTDIGTFKSLTGWREFDASFTNDADFTPYRITENQNTAFTNEQWSQEFQFINTFFDNKLDITAGLYWFEEDGFQNVRLTNGPMTTAWVQAQGMGALVPQAPIFTDSPREIVNESLAAYAQGILHVTDRLHLTAGIRWTEDTKEHELGQNFLNGITQTSIGSEKFEEVTPLISVGYDFTDDIFGYFTWSEGFRDGGYPARFNGGALPDPLPIFGPEFVTSYEVGLKTELLDRRLRLNLSSFLTDYQDYQANAQPSNLPPGTLGVTVINVGDVEIYGFESEMTALLGDNLTINWALGYLDSDIKCINSYNPDNTPLECDPANVASSGGYDITTDSTIPRLPEWTSNLSANYSMPIDGMMEGAELNWRLNYIYRGEQQSAITNTPNTQTDSWDRIDANVTLAPSTRQWTLQLGVRNLLDDVITTNRRFGGLLGGTWDVRQRGRQVYGTLRYNFGNE